MFRIENDNIYLTRGDTAGFSIVLFDGIEEYEMQDGDTLTFTVRKNVYSPDILIQKVVTENEFAFSPRDTQGYPFGNYVYDVQLNFANGDINTVIPPSLFQIMEEVTYPEVNPDV